MEGFVGGDAVGHEEGHDRADGLLRGPRFADAGAALRAEILDLLKLGGTELDDVQDLLAEGGDALLRVDGADALDEAGAEELLDAVEGVGDEGFEAVVVGGGRRGGRWGGWDTGRQRRSDFTVIYYDFCDFSGAPAQHPAMMTSPGQFGETRRICWNALAMTSPAHCVRFVGRKRKEKSEKWGGRGGWGLTNRGKRV